MTEKRRDEVALRPRFDVLAGTDALIADLARPQFGRVSRRELLQTGVSPSEIRHRVATGRLIVERRGVYAVGYDRHDHRARCATALLDVGRGTLVGHLSAAAEHGFRLPAPQVIDVTTNRRIASRPGIRVHTRSIDPAEIRRVGGLPITSPAQTLFDLGTTLGAKAHARAANEAFIVLRPKLTLDDLYLVAERNRRRKGMAAFRRLLATLDPEGREIRSPLEARLNALLRARRFPAWEQNALLRIGGDTIRPDVLWRTERVIVEADGRDPHTSPLTFDSDRRRDRRLQARQWSAVRVTSRDLGPGADELEADLWALLGLER